MGCSCSNEYTEAKKSHAALQAANGKGFTELHLEGDFSIPSFCDVKKRHPDDARWELPSSVCGPCSFDLTISSSGIVGGSSTGPDFGHTVGGWPHQNSKIRPNRPLLSGKIRWTEGPQGDIRLAMYGENIDTSGINKYGNWVEFEIQGMLEEQSDGTISMRAVVVSTTNPVCVIDKGTIEVKGSAK
jgi:hypothetical protein